VQAEILVLHSIGLSCRLPEFKLFIKLFELFVKSPELFIKSLLLIKFSQPFSEIAHLLAVQKSK
jgi:hypothetical protein